MLKLAETFLYESPDPTSGPRVLIFGAIHGDEHCGPIAIRKIMKDLDGGILSIRTGSVRFVPVCNSKAYASTSRIHKENLNRIFKKTQKPSTYEEELANELCSLVDECDVLLDIHSSFVPAPSNLFVDYPTPQNVAFANALNAEYQVYDWPKVYENNPFEFPAWTTDKYAHTAGKIGLLVECGKHDDPESEKLAEQYVLDTLSHFGLIQKPLSRTNNTSTHVYMKKIFQRDSAEDTFTRSWNHLDVVPKNTVIAKRASGEKIIASHDSYILFPKDYAVVGGEWFYLGSASKEH